jgi:hypothetical protein
MRKKFVYGFKHFFSSRRDKSTGIEENKLYFGVVGIRGIYYFS